MWLEYRPNGIVELWVTTDQGQTPAMASPPINDGRPRIIGGYLLDGVLHATCGGLEIESRAAPGSPVFPDAQVDVMPITNRRFGNEVFEGDVVVIDSHVNPDLLP